MLVQPVRYRYVRWNAGCFLPFIVGIAYFVAIGVVHLVTGSTIINKSDRQPSPNLVGLFPLFIAAILGPFMWREALRIGFDQIEANQDHVEFNGAFGRRVSIPYAELSSVEERISILTMGGRLVEVRGSNGRFNFSSEIRGYEELFERLRGAMRANSRLQ